MPNLTNFEIFERLLKTLVSKIGRRTHESYAVVAIHTILKVLEPKYNFLKYVTVKDALYSEGVDAIIISSDIDSVDSDEILQAANEIVKMTVKYLERNADFFFIREFQDALNDIGLEIVVENLDLNCMQLAYIVDRK
ncbi:MAG: hypothetical protein LN364_03435, partial [Candidatus Thermoplasmatota archaeon]|nr:hypothetical protein [Candidatus Thermoplasmatota archaeon]